MYVFVYVYGSLYRQQISNTNRPPKQKCLAPPCPKSYILQPTSHHHTMQMKETHKSILQLNFFSNFA